MKKILQTLALIVCMLCPLPAFAVEDAPVVTKEQDIEIRRMMQLTGMDQLVDQMLGQMMEMFSKQSPDIPEEFWSGLRKEMNPEGLIEKILPLYAKYYTAEDLRAINNFYETPAGQRLLKQMPQLMQESMLIGQAWGQEIGQRVAAKIQAERAARAPQVQTN